MYTDKLHSFCGAYSYSALYRHAVRLDFIIKVRNNLSPLSFRYYIYLLFISNVIYYNLLILLINYYLHVNYLVLVLYFMIILFLILWFVMHFSLKISI